MNPAPAQAAGSGWQARLELGFTPTPGRTVLTRRSQRGPLAVQRPFYPEGGVCHVYLLHPPGGVVGGDRLQIEAEVSPGGHALVTTPGATKFYLSAGDTARQTQTLRVASGARLEWLPQENIFFPGALTRLSTHIELAEGARFIGWEIQCLGRPAIDERFEHGHLDLELRLSSDRTPLLLDRLRVGGNSLDGAAGLRGLPVTATLLASPSGAMELECVRGLVGEESAVGVTLIDRLLVVRYLGPSTEQCRDLFTRVWAAIRPSVVERAPCPPRIWST
jgi:urease accessory protein